MLSARRPVPTLLASLLCALTLSLLVAPAPALAAETRFGHTGDGAGQFVEPAGVAIDQETGQVYAADRNNNRIERFGAEGAFVSGWGWGVADGATEAPQTCTAQCFAGIPGGGAGQLNFPEGIAVDNSLALSHGDVYGLDANNHRVDKYTAEGEFRLAWGEGVADGEEEAETCGPEGASETCRAAVPPAEEGKGEGPGEFERLGDNAIAVDSSGLVYVGGADRVQVFSAGGHFERQINLAGAGQVEQLAVAPGGDVYVKSSELPGVTEYESCLVTCTGKKRGEPRDEAGEPGAIAVGAVGDLFVGDSSGGFHILEYGPAGEEVASFASRTPIARVRGLAVSEPASGPERLYATFGYEVGFGETEYGISTFVPPPPGPLVVTGSETAGEVLPTMARLEAFVNPENAAGGAAEESTFQFEYGETEHYGLSTAPEATIGGGFEDRQVSSPIGELRPRTLYHFRVVVTNAAGETTAGPDQTFTTLPAVSIESESASQVSAQSALLETELNPHGVQTHFRFEYGTGTEYGHSVPAPDGEAGSGKAAVALSVLAGHLAPGTSYHYRVVASNECEPVAHPGVQCVVEGPDRTFTTQAASSPASSSSGLIDGRAWEMVSPPDKHGASLEAISEEGGLIQAAADGSGIAYFAKGPITGESQGNRSIADTQALSTRTSNGWSTQEIATPHEGVAGLEPGFPSEYLLFSTELSLALVEPSGSTPLPPLPAGAERTPYLRNDDSCAHAPGEALPPTCYDALVTAGEVPEGMKFGGQEANEAGSTVITRETGVEVRGASPDLEHVVVSSPQDLSVEPAFTPAEETDHSVYEWSPGQPAHQSLQLVSVLPANGSGEAKPAAVEGLASSLGGQGDGNVRGAISNDGDRIVFSTEGHGISLFLRDMARAETVEVDAPEAGLHVSRGEGIFQLANGEGSEVFFTATQRLTRDATAHEGKPDLYVCEVGVAAGKLACTLKDLTVDRNSGEAANVVGKVMGEGGEGRYVYFAAGGALAPGARHESCQASEEGSLCNIYEQDIASGQTRLVAVISHQEWHDWEGDTNAPGNLSGLTSRVSPNGRYLAFMSDRPLTGYDNRDAHSGQPDEEVYLYHSPENLATESGTLVCASCDPSGARPDGVFDSGMFPGLLVDRPGTWTGRGLAGSIPGWTAINNRHAFYQSRYLSNDGRLLFDSPADLVPEAGNAKEDVYEFEPAGTGGCSQSIPSGFSLYKPARAYEVEGAQGEEGAGCVGLISSGSSSEESAFLDSSENGEDVFFMTTAKLAPQDDDTAFDIYDAHVCSASPCPATATTLPPACTTADSCRVAPTPQPEIFGAPASATLGGPGNPVQSPPPAVKPKALTREQKLAKALRSCRKNRNKRKRESCERAAHRRFGPPHKAKTTSNYRRNGR